MKRITVDITLTLLLIGCVIFQYMQLRNYKKQHRRDAKLTWELLKLSNKYLEADIVLLRKMQPALDYTSLSSKDKNTIDWVISRSESYQKSIDTLCKEVLNSEN